MCNKNTSLNKTEEACLFDSGTLGEIHMYPFTSLLSFNKHVAEDELPGTGGKDIDTSLEQKVQDVTTILYVLL